MVDNIRMPAGVGPISSQRPIKPLKRQDNDKKGKRDQRFEEQLRQSETHDDPPATADEHPTEPSSKGAPGDRAVPKTTPEGHRSDGDAGHIIDIHA